MPSLDFSERLHSLAPGVFPDGLRPAQAHVLSAFGELHTSTPDLGIELPTGEGKTLIGLLIADWALDQGMSVAYLTGTRQLADQVMGQAAVLSGLLTHRFAGGHYPGAALDDYHQAQAVGVMNYWVYFNSNPRVEPADMVVFDDAHLAEQPLSGLFTLRISRAAGGGRVLYETICDLVLQNSPDAYPTLRALRDGVAPRGSPPELVAFNDWAAVATSVGDAIGVSTYVQENRDAQIVWHTLAPNLTRCGVLVGPTGIEIRPYHLPTQTVPGYTRAKQRLYLSATLGSPGDLQRRLGTLPITTVDTPPELCTTTTGRRTFLINPTAGAWLSDEVLDFALEQVEAAAADGPGRAAWLCASNSEADELEAGLRGAGKMVLRLRAGDDTPFESWRRATGAQLVTAGRFDGLDLPGDTCRLVIIPSVPAASTEFERFAVAYLGDATYMRHRIGQRVTQALGRANRTEDDSALYLGLDPAFAATLADSAVRASIGRDVSPAVRSALESHGGGWQPVRRAAKEFWATHRRPEQGPGDGAAPAIGPRPGRSRPGRNPVSGATADSADDEVAAVTRLWLGDHAGAAARAATAAEKLTAAGEPEHSAFWRYVQAHALYDSGRSRDLPAARQAVEDAVAAAPRTAWFVRLARTAESLAGRRMDPTVHDALFLTWDEWLREGGGRLPARIAEARNFLSGTHDQRAEAIEILARLCGASGDRPTGPSSSDARWVWATPRKGQRRMWEVKTSPHAVARDDVNQLLGQVREEQDRQPRANVLGCLLVAADSITEEAGRAARNEIAILHVDAALALFDFTAQLFASYRTNYGSGTAQERGAARAETELRLPGPDWLNRLLSPSGGAIMRAPNLRSALEATRSAAS
jgi:hypothetical protein